MTKYHGIEADKSWLIHATVDTDNSNPGNLDGRGAGVLIQLWTNAESKWYIV